MPSADVQDSVQDVVDAISPGVLKNLTWNKVLVTVVILAACLVVTRVLTAVLDRFLKRSKIEKTLHSFIRSLVKVLLYFLTILITVGSLGIDVTSLVALFSIVGLALSLALQGTLSNLAGGIMLLAAKPFLVGDYVEIGSSSGFVTEINLVYTRLKTRDNRQILIPNSEMSSTRVINYSWDGKLRMRVNACAAYEAPVDEVKRALQEAMGNLPAILREPDEPIAKISQFGDSSIEYLMFFWCRAEDYWSLQSDLLEEVKRSFERNGIEMSYPHLKVHLEKE